ncbi:MAG TPA: hypothetical protein ENJ46_02200 [Hellea balneolensis]|uniref:Abhydrolase domain-containing 18 n=1 Tax=Hellea balneolensis TaxID=287478 RepID=A0A7C3FXS3_9PROT|nr:hypothetical protein [Hellea balneolensis]
MHKNLHPGRASLPTRAMKSPLGKLIARPWLDVCVLYFLKSWFFPLSRLWAAARIAEGDVDKFIEHVPLSKPGPRKRKQIAKALYQFDRQRLKAFSTEQLWNTYFFGPEDVAPERLPIVEDMRLDNRTAYNTTRKLFRPLKRLVQTSVQVSPPTPEEVTKRYGRDGHKLDALFALPNTLPKVDVSRSIPTEYGRDYWIRFASSSIEMNDIVTARVFEPQDATHPPTLIFGHGICVEADHYHQLLDEITDLVKMGIRVIKPEAPWHGRRVLPGHYGGEQLLSAIPLSMIEFMAAQHKDWASMIQWSRETSTGAIAIGGSSLGAQTAKLIAAKARDWPEHLRPDALFIVAHCAELAETALDSSLSDIWNIGRAMKDQGWTHALEKDWLEKLDATHPPCMSGDNIISITGLRDTVTPARSAAQQLDTWSVPDANRFVYQRGHFSIPLGIIHDIAPLQKLADILHAQSPKKNRDAS